MVRTAVQTTKQPRLESLTIERMTLKALVEKAPTRISSAGDDEGCRQLMMNLEVENPTGVAHDVQSVSRINQRNGYRGRAWETRVGTVELARAATARTSSSRGVPWRKALTEPFNALCLGRGTIVSQGCER